MIFLALSILFGAMFAVIFKVCQKKGIDAGQVTMFNYIVALTVSVIPIVADIISDSPATVADYALTPASAGLAVWQGVLFFLGFFIMDRCTWRNGVALTTAAARASLVIPLILSALLLSQDMPNWPIVGLIIAAMLMIALSAESQKHDSTLQTGISDRSRRIKTMLALLAVFLTYGISDFSLKLTQHSVEAGCDSTAAVDMKTSSQMAIIFLSAALTALAVNLAKGSFRKNPVSVKAVLGGLVLGLANCACTSCNLKALARISTSVFYPLYNIGIVVIGTVVGVLVFKEKLKAVQAAGLALAVAAIALQLL